jgi:hypothetical protein
MIEWITEQQFARTLLSNGEVTLEVLHWWLIISKGKPINAVREVHCCGDEKWKDVRLHVWTKRKRVWKNWRIWKSTRIGAFIPLESTHLKYIHSSLPPSIPPIGTMPVKCAWPSAWCTDLPAVMWKLPRICCDWLNEWTNEKMNGEVEYTEVNSTTISNINNRQMEVGVNAWQYNAYLV